MRIQHNIAALNSYRQLSGNNSAVSKNLEKLSSGYRINRAGDDAAGLAISEKMRAQITGLETAQKNANDGISLVQTAEGALTEVHSMLNRMVELATQSANGTYDNSVDRANLQKEFDSLLEEVDRISDATNFNGINLLDGSLGGAKVTSTAGTASVDGVTGDTVTIAMAGAATQATKTDGTTGGVQAKFDFTFKDITAKANGADVKGVKNGDMKFTIGSTAVTIKVSEGMTAAQVATAVKEELEKNGAQFELADAGNKKTNFTVADDGKGKLTFTASAAAAFTAPATLTATPGTNGKVNAVARQDGAASKAELNFDGRAGGDFLGGSVKIGNKTYAFVEDAAKKPADADVAVVIKKDSTSKQVAEALANAVPTDADHTATLSADGLKVTITEVGKNTTSTDALNNGKKNFSGKDIDVEFKGTGLRLQVGDTDDDFQKVRVAVGDMSTKGLDLAALKGAGIADQTTAGTSIDKIKSAINTVSSTRGDLGAIQNRLEHTINNLGVTTENMTAAESRIRDTDMAQEMMSYTKNNILVQAAQAMLAQANQVPQGVLQLLQ